VRASLGGISAVIAGTLSALVGSVYDRDVTLPALDGFRLRRGLDHWNAHPRTGIDQPDELDAA
jgi:hypothetical protein